MAKAAKRFDIALVDEGSVGERLDGTGDAGFAQQVQRGIRGAIAEVLDVGGMGVGKLVIGMEAGDLHFAIEVEFGHGGVGDFQKVVSGRNCLANLSTYLSYISIEPCSRFSPL